MDVEEGLWPMNVDGEFLLGLKLVLTTPWTSLSMGRLISGFFIGLGTMSCWLDCIGCSSEGLRWVLSMLYGELICLFSFSLNKYMDSKSVMTFSNFSSFYYELISCYISWSFTISTFLFKSCLGSMSRCRWTFVKSLQVLARALENCLKDL